MAVTFKAGSGFSFVDVTTTTVTPTAPAGENRLLVVTVHWLETTVSAGGISINTITFNGVNMILKGTKVASHQAEMWYLVNPATSGNVVITYGGDVPTGKASGVIGTASFAGVDQVTPFGTMSSASGTSTAPSTTVTGVSTNNLVIDSVAKVAATTQPTITVGAGQTERWNGSFTGAVGGVSGIGKGSTEASAVGVVTMSWTLNLSRTWIILAVEVKESTIKDLIKGPGIIPFSR